MGNSVKERVRAFWYKPVLRHRYVYTWWYDPFLSSPIKRWMWNTQFRRDRYAYHTNQYSRIFIDDLYKDTNAIGVSMLNILNDWFVYGLSWYGSI
jgi:hypothetical protein